MITNPILQEALKTLLEKQEKGLINVDRRKTDNFQYKDTIEKVLKEYNGKLIEFNGFALVFTIGEKTFDLKMYDNELLGESINTCVNRNDPDFQILEQAYMYVDMTMKELLEFEKEFGYTGLESVRWNSCWDKYSCTTFEQALRQMIEEGK